MDLLLIPIVYFGLTSYGNAEEYCQTEAFDATCPGSEVILMTSALYGRMKPGRCVKQNYGFIGCTKDVLHIADTKCSGRNSCTVRIPDPEMDDTEPCPDDLKTYFEASYKCIPVAKATKELCRSSTFLKLVSKEGYLSSEVAATTGCGSVSSPWILEAKPGQSLNLTLLDFTRSTGTATGAANPWGECRELIILKEAETEERRITNCETTERERHLYTSKSNAIEIRLLSSNIDAPQFLVQYTVTGCKDPQTPKNSWVKRNGQFATIGCKGRKNFTWQLKCVDGVWFGSTGNCSSEFSNYQDEYSSDYGPLLLPNELSIAIILIIALILGIVILTIGLLYLRRKAHASDQRPQTRNVIYGPGPVLPPGAKYPMPPPPPSGRIARKYDENEYAMIWELQSSGNDSGKGVSVRSASISRPVHGMGYTAYTEDMIPQGYQTSDGSSLKSINDSCSSPKYFEADPSRTSSASGVNTSICMQQGRYST